VTKTPGPDHTAYELRVTPNTDLPVGKYRFTVVTQVTDAAGVAHVGPSIEVAGEMMPELD
jgi:hypothetical protein